MGNPLPSRWTTKMATIMITAWKIFAFYAPIAIAKRTIFAVKTPSEKGKRRLRKSTLFRTWSVPLGMSQEWRPRRKTASARFAENRSPGSRKAAFVPNAQAKRNVKSPIDPEGKRFWKRSKSWALRGREENMGSLETQSRSGSAKKACLGIRRTSRGSRKANFSFSVAKLFSISSLRI